MAAMNEELLQLWNSPINGDSRDAISIGTVVLIVSFMTAVLFILRWFRKGIYDRVSKRLGRSASGLHAVMLILNYAIGLVIFMLIIQFSGVNLSTLLVVFGALSVGIGFGLQNVVTNFVCGIVLLFERPVRIGDRVTIDGYEGDIVDIAMRATTMRTNEGISVIIPNAHFITSTVVNHSLDEHRIRIQIPVGVAYGTDPEVVRQTLLAVARDHAGCLNEPPAVVVFDAFGSNSMEFFLWVWTEEFMHLPTLFRSELNFAIHQAFVSANIKVPLPQLDILMKQQP